MKLIIGLGNPEDKYDLTRHNLGYSLIDLMAIQLSAPWQPKAKFKALIAETIIGGQKVLLAKPTTYYNLSGETARAILDFYKLESEDVFVIHDEMDLPFGTVRSRIGGRDAGNNGIKSIIAHIGPHFARLRVGIANEHLIRREKSDFVLGKLTTEEQKQLPLIAKYAQQLIEDFARDNKEFPHTSIKISSTT